MDPSHRTAVGLVAGTPAGQRFTVRAGTVVLAAGGIENPRLLLASRQGRSVGIGNDRDLVGRFFAEHLHVPVARLAPRGDMPRFYSAHRAAAATIRGAITLTDGARNREQLLGWALTFHNADDPHDVLSPTRLPPAYESLSVLIHALRRRERPPRLLRHLATSRPAPTWRLDSPARSCAPHGRGVSSSDAGPSRRPIPTAASCSTTASTRSGCRALGCAGS